jgi:transposase
MEETQKEEVKEKRPRRTFTEEFKKQMVELYNAGKPRAEIVKEYKLTPSALDKWISRINKTGSTKEKDNRSDLENELIALKKETKRLLLENEILKKAALIFANK